MPTPPSDPRPLLTYRDAGLDLDVYEQSLAGMVPLAAAHAHAARPRRLRRLRQPVQPRLQQPPVRPQLPPSRPRLLHRRRRQQAQGRRAGRQARHGRHRPGRHVGQRLPLHRRRAAAVPRLPGHAEGRPGPDARPDQGHQRRLHGGRLRPGRRRDGHPAGLLPAGRLRHGRLLRRRRRARPHHQRPGHPARRRGPRPGQHAACTPTATAWCARSSSSTPG